MGKDAIGFLDAAKRVIASEPDETKLVTKLLAPLYFLMCQSMELSMKSYLRSRGWTDDKLRDVGHKLDEVLHAAHDEGMQSSPDFRLVVEWMEPYHRDHTFRYHKGGRLIHVPLPGEMIRMIQPQIESCFADVNRTVRTHLRGPKANSPNSS